MVNKIYDIIIIGAGPAGMTAALYAGRAGKSVALIDKNGYGGNIALSPNIENIPGFVSISGEQFSSNMFEQISNISNVEYFLNEVCLMTYRYGLFKVSLDNITTICGLSTIIATGTVPKKLDLDTKDTYYCVLCDGPFFKDKIISVVGSGNTGATYALELASYCKTVHLCDIADKLCCEQVLQEKIKNTPNIIWHPKNQITEVKNNKNGNLTAVKFSLDNDFTKCSAIFVALGFIPQTELFKSWTALDNNNFIVSNDCTIANIPGLFVAGDCRTKTVRQVTTATSDGTIAAIESIKYLGTVKK